MAQSNISKNRIAHSSSKAPFEQVDTIFIKKGYGSGCVIDLRNLFHHNCIQNNQIVQDRVSYISTFIRVIKKKESSGESNSTLYSKINDLTNYLLFSDSKCLAAFSIAGLNSFHDALTEQARFYNSRNRFLFQAENSAQYGLKSATCNQIWRSVCKNLESCGYSAIRVTNELSAFNSGDSEPYNALSDDERDIFLRRSQEYFFQLAMPLLANEKDAPQNAIDVSIDGCTWTVQQTISPNKKSDYISYGAPLNQVMNISYYLLGFYTAFNDSQLIDIGREIDIDRSSLKTNHIYYNLEASKRRAKGQVVKAKIGGHIEKSGRRFLNTLIELSNKYDCEKGGPLIYLRSVKGSINIFSNTPYKDSDSPDILHLTCDNSHLVADYLVDQFINIVEKGRRIECKLKREVMGSTVVKRWIKMKQPQKFAPDLAFCALQSITGLDVELKGILRGLTCINLDNGLMEVSFKREQGSIGSFSCDSKYKVFLSNLETYSKKIIPDGSEKFPHYLVPFGSIDKKITQWSGIAPQNQATLLSKIGIRKGDYLLSLSSSRLRETCAKVARNDGQAEDVIALILNNSLATVFKYYSTGNSEDTKRILHEAIEVLKRITDGEDKHRAIENVSQALQIPCLTIKDASRQKGRINSAGIFCTATDPHDERPSSHSTSTRRAGKLGLNKALIPCFQYDKCIECKSAKLVDDKDALYRTLSNAEAIARGADYYPEQYDTIISLSQKIKLAVKHNATRTNVEAAISRIINEGLHPLYRDIQSIAGLQAGRDKC